MDVLSIGVTPRCGTILLQRLVSSSREIHVWGEPNAMTAALNGMGKFMGAAPYFEELLNRAAKKGVKNEWVANLNPPTGSREAAIRKELANDVRELARLYGYEELGDSP